MSELSLHSIWEQDRERVLALMEADRAPERVREVLEKELDRVSYRYCSEADEEASILAAALIRMLKSSLPVMECMTEVQAWSRTGESGASLKDRKGAGKGGRLDALSIAALVVGLFLLSAGMISALIWAGKTVTPLQVLRILLPVLAGGVLLFAAGRRSGKGGTSTGKHADPEVRYEIKADPNGVWHDLSGSLMMADQLLTEQRSRLSARPQPDQSGSAVRSSMGRAEQTMLTQILETVYGQLRVTPEDAGARQILSSVRYYLHGRNLKLVDWDERSASCFEVLPARTSGTLRPAVVHEDGTVISKGLYTRAS